MQMRARCAELVTESSMLDVIYSVAVVVLLLAITDKVARDPDWYEKSK